MNSIWLKILNNQIRSAFYLLDAAEQIKDNCSSEVKKYFYNFKNELIDRNFRQYYDQLFEFFQILDEFEIYYQPEIINNNQLANDNVEFYNKNIESKIDYQIQDKQQKELVALYRNKIKSNQKVKSQTNFLPDYILNTQYQTLNPSFKITKQIVQKNNLLQQYQRTSNRNKSGITKKNKNSYKKAYSQKITPKNKNEQTLGTLQLYSKFLRNMGVNNRKNEDDIKNNVKKDFKVPNCEIDQFFKQQICSNLILNQKTNDINENMQKLNQNNIKINKILNNCKSTLKLKQKQFMKDEGSLKNNLNAIEMKNLDKIKEIQANFRKKQSMKNFIQTDKKENEKIIQEHIQFSNTLNSKQNLQSSNLNQNNKVSKLRNFVFKKILKKDKNFEYQNIQLENEKPQLNQDIIFSRTKEKIKENMEHIERQMMQKAISPRTVLQNKIKKKKAVQSKSVYLNSDLCLSIKDSKFLSRIQIIYKQSQFYDIYYLIFGFIFYQFCKWIINNNTKYQRQEIIQQVFQKVNKLGEGNFGEVFKGIHIITNTVVAVKRITKKKIKSNNDLILIKRELHILKIVKHSSIAMLYEILETEEDIYIALEYAEKGDLFTYITKNSFLTEDKGIYFFTQILNAVKHLKKLKIAHRDLKPENILIDKFDRIKIIDFGLSNLYEKNKYLETFCGSPCYVAPEMIIRKKYKAEDIDSWSLGVILYLILTSQLPFHNKQNSLNDLYQQILNVEYEKPTNLSDEAIDFFQKVFVYENKDRITIQQMENHPLLQKYNFVDIVNNSIITIKDNIKLDENILQKTHSLFQQPTPLLRDMLQFNEHNRFTATYYLLMKQSYLKGKTSIFDINSKLYNKNLSQKNSLQQSLSFISNSKENDKFEEDGIANLLMGKFDMHKIQGQQQLTFSKENLIGARQFKKQKEKKRAERSVSDVSKKTKKKRKIKTQNKSSN